MAPSSPTVAQRELSLRLTGRRREQGIDVGFLAKSLGFTRNYWSAVENNRTLLAVDKLKNVLELLGFDQGETFELLQLREVARGRGWWDEPVVADLLTEELRTLFGLEYGANKIRVYEGALIPGILQTEEYARAVLTADPLHGLASVNNRVKIRRQRQRRLEDDEPVELTAMLSEAALVQQVSGPSVQRRQLEHLATVIESYPETVDIRVIPFTEYPGSLSGSSTLVFLEFASPHLPDIAWQEAIRQLGFIDAEELPRMELCWDQGMRSTKGAGDSLALIRSAAEILG